MRGHILPLHIISCETKSGKWGELSPYVRFILNFQLKFRLKIFQVFVKKVKFYFNFRSQFNSLRGCYHTLGTIKALETPQSQLLFWDVFVLLACLSLVVVSASMNQSIDASTHIENVVVVAGQMLRR